MQWVNNIRVPQFSAADICKAGRIELPTLKARQQRRAEHHQARSEDRVGRGRGTQNLYTWMTLMHEVLTEELVRFGLTLVHANDAAAGFALIDDGVGFDLDEPIDWRRVRGAGQVYDEGLTYLVVPREKGLGRTLNIKLEPSDGYLLLEHMVTQPVICLVDVSRFDRMARGHLSVPNDFFMMKDNRNVMR